MILCVCPPIYCFSPYSLFHSLKISQYFLLWFSLYLLFSGHINTHTFFYACHNTFINFHLITHFYSWIPELHFWQKAGYLPLKKKKEKQKCLHPKFLVQACLSSTIIPSSHTSMLSLFSSVQSLSRVWLFAAPWIAAHQASLSITNSQSLLKLMPIESVMPSSYLILCCPLLLLPQSLPASGSFAMSKVFTWGGQSMEFQLQHQSFQWTPRAYLL